MRSHVPFSVAALTALAAAASAQEDDPRMSVDELRRQLQEMRTDYERRISELEKRLAEKKTEKEEPDEKGKPDSLQEQIDELLDRVDAIDTKAGQPKSVAAPPTVKLVDVSLDALFAAGTSSERDSVIQSLEGGGHDPKKRGFTVQNVELVLAGAVDPYFNAQTNVVTQITPEGETNVELEEAYATTSSLPAGLQLKAGQFVTEFGRLNPQHPHQWDFVDQPVVNSRFLGEDGMRGPGARLSWLVPGWPLELQLGAQNANGETMVSFLGTDEEAPPFGAHVGREVRCWSDLVTTMRASTSVDLSEEIPFQFGVSRAMGPSGASKGGDTSLTGADVVLKWKPLTNDHGFPFVAVQAEWMRRRFGYDAFVADGTFVPGGELRDSGGYLQGVWGFSRGWTAGLRYDRANGTDDDVLGMDDRIRLSAALTYFPTEFSKVRLQVNLDDAAALSRHVTSVWLQFEFNLGAHGAHKF
jgi:hypothetical protein